MDLLSSKVTSEAHNQFVRLLKHDDMLRVFN